MQRRFIVEYVSYEERARLRINYAARCDNVAELCWALKDYKRAGSRRGHLRGRSRDLTDGKHYGRGASLRYALYAPYGICAHFFKSTAQLGLKQNNKCDNSHLEYILEYILDGVHPRNVAYNKRDYKQYDTCRKLARTSVAHKLIGIVQDDRYEQYIYYVDDFDCTYDIEDAVPKVPEACERQFCPSRPHRQKFTVFAVLTARRALPTVTHNDYIT